MWSGQESFSVNLQNITVRWKSCLERHNVLWGYGIHSTELAVLQQTLKEVEIATEKLIWFNYIWKNKANVQAIHSEINNLIMCRWNGKKYCISVRNVLFSPSVKLVVQLVMSKESPFYQHCVKLYPLIFMASLTLFVSANVGVFRNHYYATSQYFRYICSL